MKKLMIALAVASLSTVALAQETVGVAEVPTEKYSVSTNSFWSNWFLSVGGDYITTSPRGEDWSLLKGKNSQFGVNVALGKWFTPGLGLRFKYNTWKGKYEDEKFNLQMFRLDAMFNLSNMLCGYSDTRVWNVIPFLGFGDVKSRGMAYDLGLQSSWRLSKRMNVFAEASFALADKHGKVFKFKNSYDKFVDLSVGLAFNLGSTGFKKTPDVDALMALNAAQLDALNSALAAQQAENAKLKSDLAKKPKEVVKTNTVKEILAAPQSVFFNIGSSQIASKKEIVNLQALADMVKETSAKLRITGYADSATGSAAYNQTLSEKRANRVADELVKLGVSRDNLIVEGKGGVATLKPNSYNRRVIIEAE